MMITNMGQAIINQGIEHRRNSSLLLYFEWNLEALYPEKLVLKM